jgi:hypothetical protein
MWPNAAGSTDAAQNFRAGPTALARPAGRRQGRAMRTVSSTANVRLYHLDENAGTAVTLFYGPLAEALTLARQQSEDVQPGLWLATENDVVAFLDMEEG